MSFIKFFWNDNFEIVGLASKKTKETVEYKTARNRLTIVKALGILIFKSLAPTILTLLRQILTNL